MTELSRETAQWRKAKTPIISKYAKDHSEVMAAIAGRGFLSLPGYAYDLVNDLELTAKQSLSEINFKILSDTIERELKQTGLDYDLAFKNALITWELEKQGLLGDWDQELAGIKMDMDLKEDVLRGLLLAVAARESLLVDAKTAIELEAEGYKQTIVGLEDDVANSEVLLANAKLLTAQRKLTVIPILQQIIVVEQALIGKEQLKAVQESLLIAKTTEVVNKKGTLSPDITALQAATNTYKIAVTASLPKETAITNEKRLTIASTVTNTGKKVEQAGARTELSNAQSGLFMAKSDVDLTKLGNEEDLLAAEVTGFTEIVGKESELSLAKIDVLTEVGINTGKNVLEVAEKVLLEGAESNLFAAKHALDLIRLDNEQDILAAQIKGSTDVSAKQLSTTGEMLSAEQRSNNDYRNDKQNAIDADSGDALTAIEKDSISNIGRIGGVSFYRRETAKQVAHLNATAKITATLTHLLSM